MIEVAALTASIAVNSAAAKAIEASRAGANVANMAFSLFLRDPPLGHVDINAGIVPNAFYLGFSV
jgi:hypothetical protein